MAAAATAEADTKEEVHEYQAEVSALNPKNLNTRLIDPRRGGA